MSKESGYPKKNESYSPFVQVHQGADVVKTEVSPGVFHGSDGSVSYNYEGLARLSTDDPEVIEQAKQKDRDYKPHSYVQIFPERN